MRRYIGKLIIQVTTPFWLFYFYVLCQGKVEGVKNIPDGACILAFNHVSYLDWIVGYSLFLLVYRKKIHFIGKSKLQHYFLWKYYLLGSDTIIIDYSSKNSYREMMQSVKSLLAEGKKVGIFPEATRSPDGKIQKAEEGLAHLILQTKVPVVPVGLKGFFEAWPRHQKWPGIARCSIHIGKPFVFSNPDHLLQKHFKSKITAEIMNEIANLSGSEFSE